MTLAKRMYQLRFFFARNGNFLLSFFLFGLLIGLIVWDQIIHIEIKTYHILSEPFPSFIPAAYPKLTHTIFPSVSAQGVYVMDASSHVTLYAKNEAVRFSPASTTKIMTSLIALDHFDTTDILTTWDVMDTEGSGLGLVSGEQMTFGDLLYGALLPSANDAAYTIAENYPGGLHVFINMMNNRAKTLSLYNTKFSDPAGLDDDGDYTTPKDLTTIADAAMQDPIFRRVVSTKSAVIQSIDKQFTYPIESRNILLGQYGITGIKTGSTQEAGQVLVTSAVYKGHMFYIVVMKSDDRFADTEAIVRFIEANLDYQSIRL